MTVKILIVTNIQKFVYPARDKFRRLCSTMEFMSMPNDFVQNLKKKNELKFYQS